ncbi:MAG TPA: hypothetical protein PKD54_02555 [Pirellulaceae bacterium]|nr:hypothetical protein [Pirellulaceae bacterium]
MRRHGAPGTASSRMTCWVIATFWVFAGGSLTAQQIGDTPWAGQREASQREASQRGVGQREVGQQGVGNQGVQFPGESVDDRPPSQPDFLPLSPRHQQFVEDLLDYWEQSSAQVKRCVCDFQLYEYDANKVNWRDPKDNRLAAYVIRRGQIRFSDPDKAFYESNQAWGFELGLEGNPDYKPVENDFAKEKWLCDGAATYFYDFPQKRLYESVIPPEYRGQGLVNSPLPFLFGAKKEVILNRFWVRIITPDNIDHEYWLEAYPKLIDDARAYQKVQLVISRQDFLPSAIHIYAPNYDPVKNPTSRLYEFGNRKINNQLHNFQDWLGVFIRPKTPLGWEWVDMSKPTEVNPQRTGAAPTGNAAPLNR